VAEDLTYYSGDAVYYLHLHARFGDGPVSGMYWEKLPVARSNPADEWAEANRLAAQRVEYYEHQGHAVSYAEVVVAYTSFTKVIRPVLASAPGPE
jgi:hypothetical protein